MDPAFIFQRDGYLVLCARNNMFSAKDAEMQMILMDFCSFISSLKSTHSGLNGSTRVFQNKQEIKIQEAPYLS